MKQQEVGSLVELHILLEVDGIEMQLGRQVLINLRQAIFECIELLLEIILVLAPKLLGSNLAGRLPNPPSALPPQSRYLRAVEFTIVNDCRGVEGR